MKADILKRLKEQGLSAYNSKTVLPLEAFESYVHPEHMPQMVKLIAPSGMVEVLRYDSTIACAAAYDATTQNNFYYDEPRFYYDFTKGQIIEEDQMGVEWMMRTNENVDTEKLYYSEVLPLAIQIAEIMTEGAYQLELGRTGILEAILACYPEEKVDLERLSYYFSRKNKRKVSETFTENSKTLELILAVMGCRGSYKRVLEEVSKLNLPESIRMWLEDIGALNMDGVTIDLTVSDRLNYYSGNVFKIYDLNAHQMILSGGMYALKENDIKGVGFSVETAVISDERMTKK